jgi:hypothetical protein
MTTSPADGTAASGSGRRTRRTAGPPTTRATAHDLRKLPNLLTQRLPGTPVTVEVELRLHSEELGARAGLAVLGDAYGWIGLQRGADGEVRFVHRFAEPTAERERDAGESCLAPEAHVRLRIEIGAEARCRFFYDVGGGPRPTGRAFAATPWRWVGALLGLFALAPAGAGHAGAAVFTRFRISPVQ